jgi:GGDEF domain-containing protein
MAQLGRLNVNNDALARMEQRLNERMDTIMDSMRLEWLQARRPSVDTPAPAPLSVLQVFETNVGDDEALADILNDLRAKADAGELDENNLSQIQTAILERKKQSQGKMDLSQTSGDLLGSDELMFLLNKEIARAKRYDTPFCVLAFSIVSAKSASGEDGDRISLERVLEAAEETIVDSMRDADFIGRIGKNRTVIILPMTTQAQGKKALERLLHQIRSRSFEIDGMTMQAQVAGIVAGYDSQQFEDARGFAKHLTNQLTDMIARIKNVQVLF